MFINDHSKQDILSVYNVLLYGFEGSCILIGRRAVRKNPYSDRGP